MQCLMGVLRSVFIRRPTAQRHDEDKGESPPPPEYSAPPRYDADVGDTNNDGTDSGDTGAEEAEEDAACWETTVFLMNAEGRGIDVRHVRGSILQDLVEMQAMCIRMGGGVETVQCTMSKSERVTFKPGPDLSLEKITVAYEKTRHSQGRRRIEGVYAYMGAGLYT